jgi:hypothetical protein
MHTPDVPNDSLQDASTQAGYQKFAQCLPPDHMSFIARPKWNDRKIRGNHHPLGGRWDRITLFVNRQGETGGINPPAAGSEGMTFAIWGPWGEGAL